MMTPKDARRDSRLISVVEKLCSDEGELTAFIDELDTLGVRLTANLDIAAMVRVITTAFAAGYNARIEEDNYVYATHQVP